MKLAAVQSNMLICHRSCHPIAVVIIITQNIVHVDAMEKVVSGV